MNSLLYKDLSLSVLGSTESLSLIYPSLTQLSVNSLPLPILFRSDWFQHQKSQIALITGGGAGHEPAHSQYIGQGMLTAAVSGQIFASPSVELISDTIDALIDKSGPGVLFIVKNYTGDRLNFGLACEQAKAKGINARMITVEDDCSIDKEKGVTGRRGIAGTVLVHKIAGALSEQSISLDELYDRLYELLQKIRTIGAAFSSCAIPGRIKENRIPEGFVELGLGIHNEPGVQTIEYKDLGLLVGRMMEKLLSEYSKESANFIVLINNLGICTAMEMGLIAREIHYYFQKELKTKPVRVYSGGYMTSFDMKGFSITLMEVDKSKEKEVLGYLDHPVNAPGWSNYKYFDGSHFGISKCFDFKRESEPLTKITDFDKNNTFGIILERIAMKLLQHETELNELDSHVGDGDCGGTFALGAKRILDDMKSYPLKETAETLQILTKSIEKSMGGTSGVIYRIFLTALARDYAKNHEKEAFLRWKMALEGALEALLSYDRARQGHRTMLDALIPSIRSFGEAVERKLGGKECVKEALSEARKGVENTKNMKAGAGRSNYVPEEILKKYEDPGAKAISLIWEAILEGINEGN